MALSITQTVALGKILSPGMKIASMGYPDLIAPPELINRLFPVDTHVIFRDDLPYREDSEVICRRHGLKNRPIPDAMALFNLLGCELDVYDIVEERGGEIIADLNEPLSVSERYDVVLDVGTVEHCFNIAQAIFDMAGLVKLGGHIIHENPGNWFNHGFYNLNPTWYHDFYKINGFELVECMLVTRDGRTVSVPPTQRFVFTESEANVFAMAQRVRIQQFVFPVQSKYAKLIPAKEKAYG